MANLSSLEVDDIEGQIKTLMELKKKKLIINKESDTFYNNHKHLSVKLQFYKTENIETFEFLRTKHGDVYNSELIFAKVLESKNLVYATSLFLGDYLEIGTWYKLEYNSYPHFIIKIDDLLKLAMCLNDIDRLKLIVHARLAKFTDILGHKYDTNNFKIKNVSLHESDKFNNLLKPRLNMNTNVSDADMKTKTIAETNIIFDLLYKNIKINTSLEIIEYILSSIKKTRDVKFEPGSDDIKNETLEDVIIHYIKCKNDAALYKIKSYLPDKYHPGTFHNTIMKILIQMNSVEWFEKIYTIFSLTSYTCTYYYQSDPYINFNHIGLDMYIYLCDKFTKLSPNWIRDYSVQTIIYCEKINRNDIAEYLINLA